jgi:hypothetical protein
MNERIRELIEQAGMTRILDEHAHEYGNGMFENTPYPELEKFAELIVRECVKKCDFVAAMAEITNTGEMARKTKATANSCARMIEEHFGVEE